MGREDKKSPIQIYKQRSSILYKDLEDISDLMIGINNVTLEVTLGTRQSFSLKYFFSVRFIFFIVLNTHF